MWGKVHLALVSRSSSDCTRTCSVLFTQTRISTNIKLCIGKDVGLLPSYVLFFHVSML